MNSEERERERITGTKEIGSKRRQKDNKRKNRQRLREGKSAKGNPGTIISLEVHVVLKLWQNILKSHFPEELTQQTQTKIKTDTSITQDQPLDKSTAHTSQHRTNSEISHHTKINISIHLYSTYGSGKHKCLHKYTVSCGMT